MNIPADLPPDLQLWSQRHRVLGGVVPQPLPLSPGSGRGRQSRASKHRVRRQGKPQFSPIDFPITETIYEVA